MTVMAPPKKTSGSGKLGRPQKYPDAPGTTEASGRTGAAINFRIDPDLRALMPKFQAKFFQEHNVRLDKTAVIEKALREMFQRAGLLPPDSPSTPISES